MARRFPLVMVLMIMLVITGCRENGRGSETASLQGQGAQTMSRAYSGNQSPSDMTLDRSKFGNRRIAETHRMQIEVAHTMIQQRFRRDLQQCRQLGCELVRSSLSAKRRATIHARIPPQNLGRYLDFLAKGPGEVKSHQISADDKTFAFIDTQTRLDNRKALRDRLLKLLNSSQSDDIGNILKIERELSRVQQEIEQAKGKLRHLKTITGMATVHVTYRPPYNQVEVHYHNISQSFEQAWAAIIRNTGAVITFTGAILPWIPVFFIGLWIVVKMFKFAFGRVNWGRLAFWRKDKSGNGQTVPDTGSQTS